MKRAFIFFFGILSFIYANAQQSPAVNSSEILLKLKKLKVLGSVLYIAAHPDDENTRLLAYLANDSYTGRLSCFIREMATKPAEMNSGMSWDQSTHITSTH